MAERTFDDIKGRQILWEDKQGFVHACEGADVHRNVRLLWTLCERDVPANAAFHPADEDKVTCMACIVRVTPNASLSGASRKG